MLLHFPFNEHFNDVTCKRAQGHVYGPGNATIVYDAILGVNVVEFDGNSRIEVCFATSKIWIIVSWVHGYLFSFVLFVMELLNRSIH